jgi:hypothetical protein
VSDEVRENISTVGYSYAAELERDEKVDKLKYELVGDERTLVPAGNARQTHRMAVSGKVHPEPYNHPSAVVLAQRKLQPLVDLGWRIETLRVEAYR